MCRKIVFVGSHIAQLREHVEPHEREFVERYCPCRDTLAEQTALLLTKMIRRANVNVMQTTAIAKANHLPVSPLYTPAAINAA